MKHILFIAAASFLFAGCFEFDILVKVNPNGSGTVEQTMLMNKTLIEQMKELTESFGGVNGKKFKLIDKKKLIADAKKMGAGVHFRSVKPIAEKEREGYVVYYSFDDINTLKLNQNPSDKATLPSDGGSKAPVELLTFSFKSGTPAILTIRQPEKSFTPDSASDSPQEPSAAAEDTAGFAMMTEMIKGFRMSMAIELPGSISKTNAAHIDGKRITLMEMDFEQLMRNREKFKELSTLQPKSVEETKKILKDIPGIMIEPESVITIEFQ